MRIEQSAPLPSTVARRSAAAPGNDGRFAEALASDTVTNSANAPSSVASVDNLFVLQEVSDALGGRRRAVQRGDTMLDRLDDIRVALLTGSLPRAQLESLRHLAREQIAHEDDPQLAAILDEIELRVAVELAKLDKVG